MIALIDPTAGPPPAVEFLSEPPPKNWKGRGRPVVGDDVAEPLQILGLSVLPQPSSSTDYEEMLLRRIAQRKAELLAHFKPANGIEEYLVADLARTSVRLEIVIESNRAYRQLKIHKIERSWESDQAHQVELLRMELSSDPSGIVDLLEATRYGAEWLIGQWQNLAQALKRYDHWDEIHRRHAFDLLGIPQEFRTGSHRVPAGTDVAGLTALVQWQVERLRHKQETVLIERDRQMKAEALARVDFEPDAAGTRRIQYEEMYRKQIRQTEKQLLKMKKTRR